MLAPEQDLADRRPIWDELQMFWMDTDPALFLKGAAQVCARSKYTLTEIEHIYWNEVCPAVRFNLFSLAGAWQGFHIDWLSERILKTNRFGRRLPIRFLHRYVNDWWEKLRSEIERERVDPSAKIKLAI
jgi:hypothetical protein